MKLLFRFTTSIFLHIYASTLCLGAMISVPFTAFLLNGFSALIRILSGKNIASGVFFLFPFNTYEAWKNYLLIIQSFIKHTNFPKAFWILYYKFRVWDQNLNRDLPYFKFPYIKSDSFFYEPSDYPELNELHDKKQQILGEYLAATDLLKYYVNEAGVQHNDWQTIFLYGSGLLNEKIKDKFPLTLEIINKISGIEYSMILFSVLKPGAHIPLHTGPFNAFLRVHLPLIIPKDEKQCSITVGTETSNWSSNELLVFDDSFAHKVINNTNETRVILMLAIEKHNIPDTIKPLIHQFISHLNSSPPFKQWMLNNS